MHPKPLSVKDDSSPRRLGPKSGPQWLSRALSRADVNTSRGVSGKPDVSDCASHFEKMLYDNAHLACVYLHAWQLTGNDFYRTIVEETLDYVAREIAILGRPDLADTQALLSIVRDGYRPFQVVALGPADMQPPVVPLLRDRGLVDGRAAAYVCRDFACQAPVTTSQTLGELLDRG